MSSRLLVATVFLLVVPSAVSAHRIGVEARLKGDRVAVEAFFDDDTPAADSKVVVTAEDGKVVAEGKADAKGMWSFPAPAPGKYKVAVDAGGGHLAKTTITIPARPAAVPSPPTPNSTSSPSGAEPEVVISDGPTRAEMTGWWRWLMAGVGLALIGVFAWGFRLLARRNGRPQATGATR